jgi:hypothetical protein
MFSISRTMLRRLYRTQGPSRAWTFDSLRKINYQYEMIHSLIHILILIL